MCGWVRELRLFSNSMDLQASKVSRICSRPDARDFAHLLHISRICYPMPNTQETPPSTGGMPWRLHRHHCTRSWYVERSAAAQMLVRRVTAVFRGVPIVEVVVVQDGGTRGGGRIQSTGRRRRKHNHGMNCQTRVFGGMCVGVSRISRICYPSKISPC